MLKLTALAEAIDVILETQSGSHAYENFPLFFEGMAIIQTKWRSHFAVSVLNMGFNILSTQTNCHTRISMFN
jgi:hypothetical protein